MSQRAPTLQRRQQGEIPVCFGDFLSNVTSVGSQGGFKVLLLICGFGVRLCLAANNHSRNVWFAHYTEWWHFNYHLIKPISVSLSLLKTGSSHGAAVSTPPEQRCVAFASKSTTHYFKNRKKLYVSIRPNRCGCILWGNELPVHRGQFRPVWKDTRVRCCTLLAYCERIKNTRVQLQLRNPWE